MKKFLIVLSAVLVIYACSSGSESRESGGSLLRPTINSSIDLRLGQVSSSSSPVAVSAALENGESIVAFISDVNFIDVVYVSSESGTILVTTDITGRPKSAETENALILFSNYTKDNTVDITIQLLGSATAQTNSIFLPAQEIDPKTISFLESDTLIKIVLGIEQDIDSGIRSLLASALGALKTLGCSTEQTIDSLNGIIPAALLDGICTSKLLDSIEPLIEQTGYDAITVNISGEYPECNNPQSYPEKADCSLLIGAENALAAPKSSDTGETTGDNTTTTEGGIPGDNTGGGDTTDSNTGGGETTGSNNTGGSNTGDNSDTGGSDTGGDTGGGNNGGGGFPGFTGSWSSSSVNVCNRGNATVRFNVVATGSDIQCTRGCSLSGTFRDLSGNIINLSLNGEVTSMGSIKNSTGTSDIRASFQGTLNMNGTGNITIDAQNLSCRVANILLRRS